MSDKFSLIKKMLSGHKEAISIESRYIMKVDISDVVKDHSLIEIGVESTIVLNGTLFLKIHWENAINIKSLISSPSLE